MPTASEIIVDQAVTADTQQAHARIRAKVIELATRGRRSTIHPDVVAKAFADHPLEFAEYRSCIAAARQRKAEQQEAAELAQAIRRQTKRVLAEWDEERRQKAETEARRRLGATEAT